MTLIDTMRLEARQAPESGIVAVMNHGVVLEELTVQDLMQGRMTHAYTRELYEASAGYTRRLETQAAAADLAV